METEPDQSTDKPVEEKATPRKKAVVKRKKPTPKKQRPRKVAAPVAPVPVPLTAAEIRETLTDARTQFVGVVAEPVTTALAAWSETARAAIGGFVEGLLGHKKKDGY